MSFPAYPEYKESGVDWLGKLPIHWPMKRLKRVFRLITDGAEEKTNPIALENIESWSARYVPTEADFSGEGTAFAQGDILFGKLRPYLAKAYLATSSGEAIGDFHVLRPSPEVVPEYGLYYVLSEPFISAVNGATYGAKMPRVGWEVMGSLIFAHPPVPEQEKICQFLAHEVARIDALIEEQKRLIELLKEKRQAVISHAVTKGLDPDVRMKDSGVKWLGEVPEHWSVLPLRRVMIGDLLNGIYKSEDFKTSDGIPFIQMGEAFGDRVFAGGTKDRIKVTLEEGKKWMVREGDLLFARRSIVPEGSGRCVRIGTLRERHVFESSMIRVRLDTRRIYPRFAHLAFDSAPVRAQVLATTKTVTISGIDGPQLKATVLPVPPLEEQEHVADYVDEENRRLTEVQKEAEATIGLLRERRSALISAAVTGKIDVRNWQPPEGTDESQAAANEYVEA